MTHKGQELTVGVIIERLRQYNPYLPVTITSDSTPCQIVLGIIDPKTALPVYIMTLVAELPQDEIKDDGPEEYERLCLLRRHAPALNKEI